MPYRDHLSPPDAIIEDARQGRMVILVDDEDRENEGDLVIPAGHCTPEAVNFMAKEGRGLICLALTGGRVDQLGLELMNPNKAGHDHTAFTVSIEASEGVTTGISAADRARTVEAAIAPQAGPGSIVTPGHVFPLVARDGGVLERAGHTEAAVDLARLAGQDPSGVICEIMNDDGTMARLPDLIDFAGQHGLKIGTIADLIAYRRRWDKIVERTLESEIDSRYGGRFRLAVYVNTVAYAEHIALVRGDIDGDHPAMVRVHALDVLDDVLGDHQGGKVGELHTAMEMVAEHGAGVVLLIREPRATSLSDRLRARLEGGGSEGGELRDYGIGAQILHDLGVRRMILLSNNHRPIVGLEGYGLEVVERRGIPAQNERMAKAGE